MLIALLGLFGMGEWYNPGVVRLESLVPPLSTTTTLAPSLNLGTSPAAQVLIQLLSTAIPGFSVATPATPTSPADPLLSSCSTPALPVAQLVTSEALSAPSGPEILTISAYSAGLGPRVLYLEESAIKSCGYSYVTGSLVSPVNGFTAQTTYQGSTYQEVIFGGGDVVIRVLAFPGTYPSLVTKDISALSLALSTALTTALLNNSCADPAAPSSEYVRNPTQAGYVGLRIAQSVTLPSGDVPPDASLLNATPPTRPVPPTGSVVYPPTAPTAPAYPPTAATIEVPQTDIVGPGCGWSFTGISVPKVPVFDTNKAASAAVSTLLGKWAAWPSAVTMYLDALATYNADLASYNLWLTTPTSTTTSTTTTTTTTTATTSTTVPVTTTTIPVG